MESCEEDSNKNSNTASPRELIEGALRKPSGSPIGNLQAAYKQSTGAQ